MLQVEPSPAVSGSLYLPEPATVLSVETLTGMEHLYRIELNHGQALGHRPGQFVQVWIPGIGECPISICSSPTRGRAFELCVRRVGQVTEHIHRLRQGDELGIRGPFGRGFRIKELERSTVVVVVGGLGLAPARSLIQYVLDERERFDGFHVLYGARTPGDLLFRDDLAHWAGGHGIRLHVTVDRPDAQWRGRSGVVTTLFRELPPLEPSRTVVAVIGPPVMFKFVVAELAGMGIPEDHVYCSLERRMQCGVGKCGHCQINSAYVCTDGPVFTLKQMRALPEALS